MKRIDYSLRRWTQLPRFVLASDVPMSNSRVENLLRRISTGHPFGASLKVSAPLPGVDLRVLDRPRSLQTQRAAEQRFGSALYRA